MNSWRFLPPPFKAGTDSVADSYHRRRSSIYLPATRVDVSPRLKELRREASVRCCIEEDYASEKFTRNSSQLSESWAGFVLVPDPPVQATPSIGACSGTGGCDRSKSVSEPVHIFTNLHPSSCSPSPTRIEKVSETSKRG
ncbi:unnamed protein product [Soboliphyme baturini]|uniref:Uncharacterized protein n=1 Tax=Soboliphyme baturini TaxID=241478 RepID=A0A183J6Q6_9BILA|nr:unnamed protein product [Soboliphyme baturini]